MKIHLLIVLFIALIFNSCNKKSLPPKDEEPEPVFYFKCNAGGFPVDLKAGVNAYYMKSSYYQDSNMVYVFKGELKQKECTDNCGFGLTVLINDYKISANSGTTNIDSTLIATTYQYNDGNIKPLYYTGTFLPVQTIQNCTFNWLFSDGGNWNSMNCARSLKAGKTYTVSLTTNNTLYGSTTLSNVYNIGNPVQANVTTIRSNPLAAFYYKFSTANLTGTAPFTYLWDFGDNYTSAEVSPTHEYIASGLYTTKLMVADANQDTCICYYQVPAFNGSFEQSNFNANFAPVPNTYALSTISILVNDPKGTVYSLSQNNQQDKNNFEIVSVEDYKASDSNQSFKKVKIKFNCTVYNGSTSLDIKDGEAVIAIAYK